MNTEFSQKCDKCTYTMPQCYCLQDKEKINDYLITHTLAVHLVHTKGENNLIKVNYGYIIPTKTTITISYCCFIHLFYLFYTKHSCVSFACVLNIPKNTPNFVIRQNYMWAYVLLFSWT